MEQLSKTVPKTTNARREILLCPVCQKPAEYLTGLRDRDLHPPIAKARYSCGKHGHVIATNWVELGLGVEKDDPELELATRQAWFQMIAQMSVPTVMKVATVHDDAITQGDIDALWLACRITIDLQGIPGDLRAKSQLRLQRLVSAGLVKHDMGKDPVLISGR